MIHRAALLRRLIDSAATRAAAQHYAWLLAREGTFVDVAWTVIGRAVA